MAGAAIPRGRRRPAGPGRSSPTQSPPQILVFRQDFVSRRVGNVRVHPVTGPLIAQMWVQ